MFKRVLPCSDDNRRNGRFWLLEAGKEGEVETKIFFIISGIEPWNFGPRRPQESW